MAQSNCLKSATIQEYLDKSLPVKEMEAVAAHVNHCGSCRRELAEFVDLYRASAEFSRGQVSIDLPPARIDEVMLKIRQPNPSSPGSNDKAAKPFLASLSAGLRWLLLPALAAILLFFVFTWPGRPVDNKNAVSRPQQFSLQNNSVEVILGSPDSAAFKTILPDREIKLPENTMILVRAGTHRFKFGSRADFVFKTTEITLNSGLAYFDLSGNHADFKINTPSVVVTPLGTSFELEVRSWGTRIDLRAGKIELINRQGEHKSLSDSGTIYVSMEGKFSKAVPQPNLSAPVPQPSSQPHTAPAGQQPDASVSPAKLLDSF